MHVLERALDLDLPVRDPAQPVGDGRRAVVVLHVRVGHDAHVGGEEVRVRLDELGHRLADVLLVAFEHDPQVDGQVADALQPRLGGAEVHVQLPLVVPAATGVHDVVLVPRLERRTDPLLQRINRLDVVVAVDQDGGLVRSGVEPVGGDHRVAAGLGQPRVLETDGRERVRDPLRGPHHFIVPGGIRADRFHAQELVQAAQVLIGVLAEVGECALGLRAACRACPRMIGARPQPRAPKTKSRNRTSATAGTKAPTLSSSGQPGPPKRA